MSCSGLQARSLLCAGSGQRKPVLCTSSNVKRSLASQCMPAALGFMLAMKAGGGVRALAASSTTANIGVAAVLASGWGGLLAGCFHTLTGLDHLAALAPLCVGRSNRLVESAALGALWGCGHDVGHILFGILFLLLRDKLKIDVLRVWGARIVGLTLVAIGAVGIKEAQAADADDLLVKAGDDLEQQDKNKSSLLFTFGTGLVYGMQPDALLMIFPALAMPSRAAGLMFLGMFSLGTVLSMSSYTLFLASCSDMLHKRLPKFTRNLSWISSVLAIVFGIGVIWGELIGMY